MAPALWPLATALVDYTFMIKVDTSASQAMTATAMKPFAFGMGGNATVRGSAGDDFLVGDYFDRVFLNGLLNDVGPVPPAFDAAMAGHDVILAGDGDDTPLADLGNDTLDDGLGNDVIMICVPGSGSDSILGGAGWDKVSVRGLWGLGFDRRSTSRLVPDAATGIEVPDLQSNYPDGTEGDDLFDLSGLALNL